MNEDLHVKYRPATLNEVAGQQATVKALKGFYDSDTLPHAILFSGPSGVGKTTLARILATEYCGVRADRIVEVDAATYSKAENTRTLIEGCKYRAIHGGNTVLIIDECHALSSMSWQVLLKTIEEPPEHVYFILCTTEFNKVPKTIKTRCHVFHLEEVPKEEMLALVEDVCIDAGIQLAGGVVDEVVRQANGSPRQALVNLSMCADAATAQEARSLLKSVEGSAEVIDLCRTIAKSKPGKRAYEDCVKCLASIDTRNYESVRIVINSYFAKAVLSNPRNEYHLHVLSCFQQPCIPQESPSQVILALADLFLGG